MVGDCRVPEEAPEAAVQLMEACLKSDAKSRPNAQAVVEALMSIVPPADSV